MCGTGGGGAIPRGLWSQVRSLVSGTSSFLRAAPQSCLLSCPRSCQEEGTPCYDCGGGGDGLPPILASEGWRGGTQAQDRNISWDRTGGTPASQTGQGVPPDRTKVPPPTTENQNGCAAPRGMPLAFTREGFLVFISFQREV